MRRAAAILVLVGLAGTGAIVYAFSNAHAAPESAPAAAPSVPSVERIAGIGYVEPAGEIRRLVFPVDGVIGKCLVEVGQTVRAGQPLMELRNFKEKQSVDLARSEWDLAIADRQKVLAGIDVHEIEAARQQLALSQERLHFAQVDFDRITSLRKSKSTSASDADEAETKIKQARVQSQLDEAKLDHLEHYVRPEDKTVAEARVAVAKAKLTLAERQFEDTNLRAPTDGTVLEILKREGDGTRVLDGQPAIVFGDISRLRVRAEVDERHVHSLKEGATATIYGRPLGNRQFTGKVIRLNRIMGPKTVFSRAADERMDLDVVQLLIDLPQDFHFPVGLRVDVLVEADSR
jgi:multidrug resistance efflux pump